ncbi:hypothetical protein IQ07DRAFT_589179 [Pyrenochaeta sp. DS3sAY3a]|nr:hypothetical protein IQ07DRAFT_589179 [Pyrenochaeta sp. DS3sAY3a]
MSNPPTSLVLKRKRNAAPVDALVFDSTVKRQRSSQNFAYRRLEKPNDGPTQSSAPPTPSTERRFHLDPVSRAKSNKHVFVEARQANQSSNDAAKAQTDVKPADPAPKSSSPPRKRPGAGSAIRHAPVRAAQAHAEPSENDVRNLEALSKEVERVDNLHIPLPSASKYKPKAPALRFAQRHPEQAAALQHDDAMDIDADDYVYDTYIREPLIPDADGKLPEPTGTVGLLVLADEDEGWWNAEDDEPDKEFDTDDEDENAEDYYANDYPEDELSDDDEFGRNMYKRKNRHNGSEDEQFDLDRHEESSDDLMGSGEDEDDLHYKMTVPKPQRTGYWGSYDEVKDDKD